MHNRDALQPACGSRRYSARARDSLLVRIATGRLSPSACGVPPRRYRSCTSTTPRARSSSPYRDRPRRRVQRRRRRLVGAEDGRALSRARRARRRCPPRLRTAILTQPGRSGIGDAPPSVLPYLDASHGSSRTIGLKSAGWKPTHTNDESDPARDRASPHECRAVAHRARARSPPAPRSVTWWLTRRRRAAVVSVSRRLRSSRSTRPMSGVKYPSRTFLYSLIDQSRSYSSTPVSSRIASIVASQSRALSTVHHREHGVRPVVVRRAPVAVRHRREAGHLRADLLELVLGHGPHAHRVRLEARAAVVHHRGEAPHQLAVLEATAACRAARPRCAPIADLRRAPRTGRSTIGRSSCATRIAAISESTELGRLHLGVALGLLVLEHLGLGVRPRCCRSCRASRRSCRASASAACG